MPQHRNAQSFMDFLGSFGVAFWLSLRCQIVAHQFVGLSFVDRKGEFPSLRKRLSLCGVKLALPSLKIKIPTRTVEETLQRRSRYLQEL